MLISHSHTTTRENKTGSWRFYRPEYREKTSPCSTTCPVGTDISKITLLAAQNKIEAAGQALLMENPFPAVCGRVCFHPCQTACLRAVSSEPDGWDESGQPVGIQAIERYIGDQIIQHGANEKKWRIPVGAHSGRPETVAVIGAGPAGLAAAWFLDRLGYQTDVFEAAEAPGGLLRWGIPAYRLPVSILNTEIARMESGRVTLHRGTPVSIERLDALKSRYDGVFVGCGLNRPVRLSVPGGRLALDGLAFLRDLQADGQSDREETGAELEGTVAVIGGGNTAVDVARSVVRLGAEPIIVYRRRQGDMPAFREEVEAARNEGIRIMELLAPVRLEENDRQVRLTVQPMSVNVGSVNKESGPKKDVAQGAPTSRPRVIPSDEPARIMTVAKVIAAIGAESDPLWWPVENGTSDTIRLDHCTLTCDGVPLVFGGDLVNSEQSAAHAIASGKEAAIALDIFFRQGFDQISTRIAGCRVGPGPALSMEIYRGGKRAARHAQVVTASEINRDYFDPRSPIEPGALALEERLRSFQEIEQTITPGQFQAEVDRCFHCGVCNHCDNCRTFCPEVSVLWDGDDLSEKARRIDLDYCKGCGICVAECPRSAMVMVEES